MVRIGDADAEIDTESTATGKRVGLAGLHRRQIRNAPGQHETSGGSHRRQRRLVVGLELAVVGGDDPRLDALVGVEAEADGNLVEPFGPVAPVVQSSTDLEGALCKDDVARCREVVTTDAVDLGRQLALTEAMGQAGDESVDVLQRQVVLSHRRERVELGRLQLDVDERRHVESVVELIGGEARSDAEQIRQIEVLAVAVQVAKTGGVGLVGLDRVGRAGAERTKGGQAQGMDDASHLLSSW